MAGVVDLSALTKYTDELATDLISKAVLKGRTVETELQSNLMLNTKQR